MVFYAANAVSDKRLAKRRKTAAIGIAVFAVTAAAAVLGSGTRTSWAQQTPPPPASVPGTAPVSSPTYKISAEDTLLIEVVDRPELTKNIQVLNDGTINYPYIGQVNVIGLTIKELQEKIRKAVERQFVKPQVLVSVQRRLERQISVLGAIKSPGKHAMRSDNYHILDALADGGGLLGERPEFFDAQLTQVKAGNVVKVDLYKLLHDNDAAENYKMEADDVLYITEVDASKVQVQIVGQMTKAGPTTLPRSGSIVEVLQMVGPPTPAAALSEVRIERNGTVIPLDLRDFYRTGVLKTDERLQPGDRLVVPENKREISVVGAAGRTGNIPYPDDRKLTVFSVFSLTGGVTRGADLKNTTLIHKNEDGTTKTLPVDVQKMVKTGDLSGDLAVVPGDTVVFKESAARKGLSPFEVIGLITGIATLYGIFHR